MWTRRITVVQMPGRLSSWKKAVQRLKTQTAALYWASRDPRVPWYAKALALLVVAYALSPIDLIPDFIPVLGQLDDLVLVPLGIALALRMIPADVMEECQQKAAAQEASGQFGFMAVVVVMLWLAAAAWVVVNAASWLQVD